MIGMAMRGSASDTAQPAADGLTDQLLRVHRVAEQLCDKVRSGQLSREQLVQVPEYHLDGWTQVWRKAAQGGQLDRARFADAYTSQWLYEQHVVNNEQHPMGSEQRPMGSEQRAVDDELLGEPPAYAISDEQSGSFDVQVYL